MKNSSRLKLICIVLLLIVSIAFNTLLYFLLSAERSLEQRLNNQIADMGSENRNQSSTIESLNQKIKESNSAKSPILPQTVILDFPLYKQKYSASCELASVHSALLYYGTDMSEDEIIKAVDTDKSTRTVDSKGNIHWGNPQKAFLGDINAKQVYVDGYGVYNQPVYKALSDFGYSKSISKVDWKTSDLFNYVKLGYPVMFWTSNDFKTKEIKTVYGADGSENPWILDEHALIIRGVDEEKVYLMDVAYGSYRSVSYSDFATGFKNLNNMAIVIIKD
jgi:uncharacterized protein YvpB